ncbi:MAG: Methicillin resistance protein [Candidatus Gottesmanbacteria bacterium GW2011_GWC2_39_8]|uniref:Methicillin resistance protein n=1 Tax=Candidatus Gottesmanbacteria bacterium GW2011_GWC2_39_8 TaxID=1618450 RepID=A0A0G0SIB8_9BACT|nr:MAG: Methicillin resistance protein [Candidatus Gottesmanbacteria bacterium GW2011_GWC2_39_8]
MEIKEIEDKNIWEKFLLEYNPGSLFQSWNWGEVQKKASKTQSFKDSKKIWRLGLFDNKELEGIAQVVKITAKRGDFLHVRHGPILSEWKKEYFLFLINYLKELSKKEKAVFIRVSPLIENSTCHKELVGQVGFRPAPIHAMDGEYVWILPLDKTEEELLSGMRKTTRYLVKQAEKLGVEIVNTKDPRDLDKFTKIYRETAVRQGFVPHLGLKEEFEILSKEDQVILLLGKYQREILSGAMIVFYGNQGIYHHSASYKQKVPVNYLLQWRAIQEAKKRGMKYYNFWGIAPEGKLRHPWEGLTTFKKGFGGNLTEYLHAQDLPISSKYMLNWTLETLRRVKKGY